MSEHEGMTPDELPAHIRDEHPGYVPMVLAVEPWVLMVVNRLMEEELDVAPDIGGSAVFIFGEQPTPVVIYNAAADGEPSATGVSIVIGAVDQNDPLHARVTKIIDELQEQNNRELEADLDAVLKGIVNPDS